MTPWRALFLTDFEGSNWLCGLEPSQDSEKGSQTRPPYLVLLNVAGMWEMDGRGEVVHVRAAKAALEEILCQQGADVGLPSACPAMQGKDQWFAGGQLLYKGLQ